MLNTKSRWLPREHTRCDISTQAWTGRPGCVVTPCRLTAFVRERSSQMRSTVNSRAQKWCAPQASQHRDKAQVCVVRRRCKHYLVPNAPRVIPAMLRKKNAQEALLLSPENSSLYAQSSYDSTFSVEDDSYVELRLTAICGGILGRVKIFEDASFSFSPHEVPHNT